MAKLNHVLACEHELMTKTAVKAMLKEENCTLEQLPYLYITDPAVEHLISTGVKVIPGSVLRITRPSRTMETESYYRLVIEPYEGLSNEELL